MSIRKGFLRNSFICFLLFTGLFAASCKSSEIPGGDESSAIPEGGTAVIDTDYGTIKIKLAPDLAPKHVSHFIKLAREGFYDGLGFHRAEQGLLIQGGDPRTRNDDRSKWGMGIPGQETVPAEFNGKPFVRGTVGMARAGDANSATSQFFICLRDHPDWNGQYTAFGEVVEGLNVADRISRLPTDPYIGTLLEKVVMTHVSIEK